MIETRPVRVIARETPSDQATFWAARLRERGIEAEAGAPEKGTIAIALLDRADARDARSLPAPLIAALDMSLHIVVLATEPIELPRLINHLPVIDAGAPDALDRLVERIALASAPDAPLPLRVLTPTVARANRSAGVWVTGIVLIMFVAALIGVGVFGLQRPNTEYELLDTAVALTRDFYLEPELLYFSTWLPRSTEDARNYSATLQQLPTAWRPLMGLTVTAYAQGTPLPPITTPVPEPAG